MKTQIGKNGRHLFAILLAVVLMFSVMLISTSAITATSGTTGDCTWTLDGTVLTISGNGSMDNYNAPWGTAITAVIINNGVTSIGNSAFWCCSKLTSVTIPNSVISIGDYAFHGCRELEKVKITDLAAWCGISFGNYGANPLYYAGNLYINGELATDITIPNSITKIGDYTFYNCTCLTNATIPDSVTSIGEAAFDGCSGLTSITIPKGITNIGNSTFAYCKLLTSITIPDSVTSIGGHAFISCSGLEKVNITDLAAWCGIAFDTDYANPPVLCEKVIYKRCTCNGYYNTGYGKRN